MRADLHVHSRYSGHSLLSLEQIVRIARKKGLDAVALTDHDTLEGALRLAKMMPTLVGEEISCNEGDVIGLFLTERVDPKPALEVMDDIHAQGGVVVVPHPFDSLRREALNSEELCLKADAVEVFNSRVVRKQDNERALAFANEHGLKKVVGSDAHTAAEIGNCWMELDSADDPRKFLKSLETARAHCKRGTVWVHAQTKVLKVREVFR